MLVVSKSFINHPANSPASTISAPIPVETRATFNPLRAKEAAFVATVCATVATVAVLVAVVFATCAVVPATVEVLLVCCAAVSAVVATVLACCVAVFISVAAFSASIAVAPSPISLFQIFFRLLSVTSEKALSLLSVCCTCCKPIVIAITDCTRSIICCSFSFSPPNNPTAPCAIAAAPEMPFKPDIMPCNPLWSLARIVACACASPQASVNRPASSCSAWYAAVPRCPAASISTSSVFISRRRWRRLMCFSAACSAAAASSFRRWSSLRSSSAVAAASLLTCFLALITFLIARSCSCNAFAVLSSPFMNAAPAALSNRSYSFSSSLIASSFSPTTRSISAKAASILSSVVGALETISILMVGILDSRSRTAVLCRSASSSIPCKI